MKRPITWPAFVMDLAGGALIGSSLSYLAYIQHLTVGNDFRWYDANVVRFALAGGVAGALAAFCWWLFTRRLRQLLNPNESSSR